MKTIIRSLAVASLLSTVAAFPAQAAPIVYTGSQLAGTASANYSIQTDGTLGALGATNITGYSITLSNGTTPLSFSNTNGRLMFSNSPQLFATNANLAFNFSFFGSIVFDLPGAVESLGFTSGLAGGVVRIDTSGASYFNFQNGLQTIATAQVAGAVPEPATWAMMIAGFGMVGFAMRRRQKVSTTVRFA